MGGWRSYRNGIAVADHRIAVKKKVICNQRLLKRQNNGSHEGDYHYFMLVPKAGGVKILRLDTIDYFGKIHNISLNFNNLPVGIERIL